MSSGLRARRASWLDRAEVGDKRAGTTAAGLRPAGLKTLALTLSEGQLLEGKQGLTWSHLASQDPSGCMRLEDREQEGRSEAHPVTWQEARLGGPGVGEAGSAVRLLRFCLREKPQGLPMDWTHELAPLPEAASSSVYSGCFLTVCLLYVTRPPRMDI